MVKTRALLILLAAIVLGGCLQEASIEERLLCVELTSYSSTEIPACDSQEKCAKEFDKSFAMNTSEFGPHVQNSLAEFRSRTSLSWLYFNKALNAVRKINAACSNGTGLDEIDSFVNEFNFGMSNAFEQIEKAHQVAFSIIFLEKADLELEEIGLMREDDLFNDYVALNENISSINSKNMQGNDFASNYFFYAKRLEELAKKTGFNEDVIKEVTVLDVFDFFDDRIISRLVNDKFWFPVISGAYSHAFSFAKNAFEVNRSAAALKEIPSFEFFGAFNWFAGTKNSTARMFTELVNSDDFHRKNLEEKNALLERDVLDAIGFVEQKIFVIDEESYSFFDQNFFESLAELSEFSSTISSDNFSVNGLSSLKSESSALLAQIKSEFGDLKSRDFISKVSLGKKTGLLKEFAMRLRELGEEIDFYSSTAIEGLKNACSVRVGLIKERIKGDFFGFGEKALGLQAGLKFKVKEFEESSDTVDSLKICRETIQDFKAFESVLENSSFEGTTSESLNKCMSELESFFKSAPPAFFDLKSIFDRLSAQKGMLSPQAGLSGCLVVREKALLFVNSNNDSMEVVSNYREAGAFLEKLKTLASLGGMEPARADFERLSKRLEKQGEFFENALLSLRGFSFLAELKESSLSLLLDAKEALKKAVESHLEKNLLVEVFSQDSPKANTVTVFKVRVSAKNLATQVDFPVSFFVRNFSYKEPAFVFMTGNVDGFSIENGTLRIDLNFVPLGSSIIVFESSDVAAKTSEQTSPLSVSVSEAFFEKKIKIESSAVAKELEVSTEMPHGTDFSSVHVLFAGKSVSFEKKENKVYFRVFDAKPNDTVSVFFSVKDPLSLKVEKAQSIQVDQNTYSFAFFVGVQNNLDVELKNIKLFALLPVDEKNFVIENAFSLEGEKIKYELLFPSKVLFSVDGLAPLEKKTMVFTVNAKNHSVFWSGFFALLEEKLLTLDLSANQKIRQKAASLKQRLLSLEQSSDLVNDQKNTKAMQLSLDVSSLLEENESFEKNESRALALTREITEQTGLLEKNAQLLKDLGFESDGEKILARTKKALSDLDSFTQKGASFEDLLGIKSSLNDLGEIDAKKLLQEEAKKLVSEAGEFLSLEKDFGLVFSGKEEVLLAEERILFYLNQNDFSNAKETLDKLSQNVARIKAQVEEKAKSILEKSEKDFFWFEELARNAPQKASKLKELEQEFIEKLNNRFFPTSSERIDKLLLKLDSLSVDGLGEKITKIKDLKESGDFVGAAKEAVLLSKSFEKNISEIKKIDNEFSSDLARVKEEAFNAYYLAELKTKNVSNAEAGEALLNAKEELDKENFTEAILLSEKAIELIEGKQKSALEIPVAVYPLVILALAGMFFKYRQKKPLTVQKTKVERVKIE